MAPGTQDSASTHTSSPATQLSDGFSQVAERHDFEPIAIVGMACRWPGDVESGEDVVTPSALWDFLEQKKDSYSDFPASRLNIDAWHHPTTNRPGSFYTRGGAFLKQDVREFDPTFFGINPQEATSLDPAQRKFLEVVYEALESSGTPMENLSGSKTGCFVGNFNYDHQLMQYRDTEYPEPYGITGGGIALLSNRVSYIFNLQGPSMTLDTACSSSMYALHLACNAIQSGECDAAVVGGSNLILTPECQVFSSALGAVSKSSRCHTFDAAADGYARADGIGAIFVKPLRQAILDNDPIRAIIRGTAINANGRTGGITHPDPDGQEKAIRRAYQRAGLDPGLTTYFECHGTGTPVGDPIEVEAVLRVFASKKAVDRPLLIGSVKSNMGHCESASGMAGIMKSILALEHGIIPPIRSLNKLNPNVDLGGGKLKIVEQSTTWPTETVRRVSVNSFGYGGANAHTILEAIDTLAPGRGGARARNPKPTSGTHNVEFLGRAELSQRSLFLLPFSAHNSQTLKSNIDALQPVGDNWDLVDLAHTLSCRRSILPTRSFAIAGKAPLSETLVSEDLKTYKSLGSQKLKLGFVFTGQGAQWPCMGLELMDSFPTYLRSIRNMDEILHSFEGCPAWSIEDSLRASPESSQVHRAELSQTLVTAIQVAMVDLLASWDIIPSVTVGHSSGEIAAVYASGRISAAEAIIIAYARGKAVSRNEINGAMLAVGAGIEAISHHLEVFKNITVACYNSPESITLSGDYDEIAALKSTLETEGVFVRVLATDGNAYHSKHMGKLTSGYEDDINKLLSRLSSILGHNSLAPATFVSSVTGKEHSQPIQADYWSRNLRSPVLFSQAVSNLVQTQSVDQLIEIGAHSALQGPIRQISKTIPNVKFPEYNPTLIRKGDGAENLLTLAGTLFGKGYMLDLKRVNTIEALDKVTNSLVVCNSGNVIVDLPKYQWTYGDQFYFENRWTREWRLRTHPRHDILGSRTPGGNQREPVWRNVLRQKDLPWLQDHKIGSDVVFPTSAFLSMAIEAATQMSEIDGLVASTIQSYELQDVYLNAALIIRETGGTETLFSLRPSRLNQKEYSASTYEFTITSVVRDNDQDVFTEHVHGKIAVVFKERSQVATNVPELPASSKPISSSRWYDAFARGGLNYGPTFQGLSNIHAQRESRLAQASVNMIPTAGLITQESRYVIHPATIDSLLQLAILAGHGGRATKFTTGFLPVAVKALVISPVSEACTTSIATAETVVHSSRELISTVTLSSNGGDLLLASSGITLQASEVSSALPDQSSTPYTSLVWRPDPTVLTAASLEELYPTTHREDGTAELATLDQLALHQIIQFKSKYPEFFSTGSSVPHLQRFLSWMAQKVDSAAQGGFPDSIKTFNCSADEREVEILRLEASLMKDHGPEAKLMCHMYRSLPAIYRGETTGIHAAVQDHLLDDMYEYMRLYHDGSCALKDLVVLLSHKNPNLKILEVGGGTGSATREVLPALKGQTPYRGYDSYTFTDIGTAFLAAAQDSFKEYKGVTYASFDMQTEAASQGFDSDYDLIIASNVIHATTNIQKTLANVRSLLKPGGKLVLFEFVQPRLSWNMILGTFSDFWNGDADPTYPRTEGPFLTRPIWRDVLPKSGFGGVDMMLDHFAQNGEAAIIMTTAVEGTPQTISTLPEKAISIVYRGQPSHFVQKFAQHLQLSGVSTELVPLLQSSRVEGGRAIFLVEIDEPLFMDIGSDEWKCTRDSVLKCQSTLYVTRGDLLRGGRPDFAMMSGIICALHTENKSTKFVTVDLGRDSCDQLQEFETLIQLEEKAAIFSPGDDFEYRLKKGVVHVSRLEPDDGLNGEVGSPGEVHAEPSPISLESTRNKAMVIAKENGSAPQSIYFEESAAFTTGLDQDEVEVEIRAAELDGRTSKHEIRSTRGLFSGSFSGVVTNIGKAVTNFKAGDKVFGLSTDSLSTLIRTKESLCLQMDNEASFEQMAPVAAAVSSATYALNEIGRLSEGETILIDSATGTVCLVACQIAKDCGAEIYVALQPGDDASLLSQFGVPEDRVFYCKDGFNAGSILHSTTLSGFDVILSAAQGEELHDIWQCIAPFGHFINFGRTESINDERLQLDILGKNATFSTLDLRSLIQHRPAVVTRLLQRVKNLPIDSRYPSLTQRAIKVSNISDVFQSDSRSGGTVLTFDPSVDTINVIPSANELTFSPQASYILVGCLGGLGRSFACWMAARGAQKLTFLSRSGLANVEATDLVNTLTSLSVEVTVVQGDVSSPDDVARAVSACTGPVKGVVQAALSLHDDLFSSMSHDDFHATLDPRTRGTLNLHHATRDVSLDFFLLWSSWTTLLGSAGQANYMASNAYMDAFAAYRHAQGLPAASLVLGQILDVGVVSDVPAYQEHLHRMGLHGADEDAFLRSCEAAIRNQRRAAAVEGQGEALVNPAQVLAGVEAQALASEAGRYPVEDMTWAMDPRFGRLVQAATRLSSENFGVVGDRVAGDGDDLQAEPVVRIHSKLARLLYVAKEDIDTSQPVKRYGIDSMVAAELRSWIFKAFKKDISLLRLLSPGVTIEWLAGTVKEQGQEQ